MCFIYFENDNSIDFECCFSNQVNDWYSIYIILSFTNTHIGILSSAVMLAHQISLLRKTIFLGVTSAILNCFWFFFFFSVLLFALGLISSTQNARLPYLAEFFNDFFFRDRPTLTDFLMCTFAVGKKMSPTDCIIHIEVKIVSVCQFPWLTSIGCVSCICQIIKWLSKILSNFYLYFFFYINNFYNGTHSF